MPHTKNDLMRHMSKI